MNPLIRWFILQHLLHAASEESEIRWDLFFFLSLNYTSIPPPHTRTHTRRVDAQWMFVRYMCIKSISALHEELSEHSLIRYFVQNRYNRFV